MRESGAFGSMEPPEGVIRGDSVPRENDEKAIEESKIDQIYHTLIHREAYSDMDRDRVRDRAKELVRRF